MKSYFICFFSLFLAFNCKQHTPQNIKHINGYWEISAVQLHHGKTQHYTTNTTIDYFFLNDSLKGFRKKVTPTLDNTYITSKNQERIEIILNNDSIIMHCKTPYATWKESVLFINDTLLKLVTPKNDVYIYNRYKPLNSY